MKRVLILHGVNTWNTGDLGLMVATVRRLREELGPQVELLSENVFREQAPEYVEVLKLLGLREVPSLLPLGGWTGRWPRGFRWLAVFFSVVAARLLGRRFTRRLKGDIGRALTALVEADVVVSKPGGRMFALADQRLPSPSYLGVIWSAAFLGRPVVIYAQSIGPFSSRLAEALMKFVLRRVTIVTAREPVTAAWLASFLPAEKARLTADEAFCLATDQLPDRADPGGAPMLGMTAISWRLPGVANAGEKKREYRAALVQVARWFIDEIGGRVVLYRWLLRGHEDDSDVLEEIQAAIGRPANVSIAGPMAPEEAIASLAQVDVVVASRLHSAIFSAVAGTPALAIEYLPKTPAIMGMMYAGDWSLPITDVGSGRLEQRARSLWASRQSMRAEISEQIPKLREAARHNARLVRELVEDAR